MYNTNTMPYSIAMTPITNDSNYHNNGGMFNGDGSWLIIILFLFIFCGWGNGNGFGRFGSGSNDAAENYVLASDFATIQRQIDSSTSSLERKADSINNGLCDGFYTQAQLINGVTQSIADSNYSTQNAITQSQIASMQNTNALQTQLAQCCCDNREATMNTNYNMATLANGITNAVNTGFCQTNYNAATNTRDIVDSQNAGTQAILAKLADMESSAKDDKIAQLTAMNSDLRFQASQAAQNTFIQNLVRPTINPCYVTANPYCSCGNATSLYGNVYGTTVA